MPARRGFDPHPNPNPGQVPLVRKAAAAQDAGALGIIVTDMGNCTAFDQFCSPGADKVREGLVWLGRDLSWDLS